MLVDNCAMQIVRSPSQFDVLLTENMFGDILSDEASMITGSIGMIPSASLGDGRRGLYEPIHGSAPDIAGQDLANPIGTILSAAMMLRYSFGMAAEADAVEEAVCRVLGAGYRTGDIWSQGTVKVGCKEMGARIAGKSNDNFWKRGALYDPHMLSPCLSGRHRSERGHQKERRYSGDHRFLFVRFHRRSQRR